MMDCYGSVNPASKPPIGRRMKSRAPPPPSAPEPAPRRIFRNAVPDGGGGVEGGVEVKENLVRSSVKIQLTLPEGQSTTSTVDGRKALMDLLVELCGQYHLNPSHHTLELLSAHGVPLGFKPNAPLGSLDVASVLIKEKVAEDRAVRRPAPKVPEKTIRLVVNYHRSQKTVIRVDPLAPLQNLVPVICDKCEFDPARVLLLRDNVSHHELPLDRTLTELGLREIYVKDQSLVLQPKMASAPVLNCSASLRSSSLSVGGSEKKGLLGIFRFNRKSKGLSSAIVPCVGDRPSTLGQSQSVMNISRMSPKAEPKKRRAPGPPQATPTTGYHSQEAYQVTPGSPRSESQLRKRKAPVPPPTPTSDTPVAPPTTPTSVTPAPETSTFTSATPAPAPRSTAPQSGVRASPPNLTASSSASSLPPLDSCSELSHSLEDSDPDPDPAESLRSTSSSYSNSSSVGVSVPSATVAATLTTTATSSTPSSLGDQSETAASNSVSEETLDLKLDEVENNRHSAMAWLHSQQTPPPDPQVSQEETLSLGSSASGGSLQDQGYAASEGMAEAEADAEDSGLVRPPTAPPGARPLGLTRESSSDSDEGCATWGSRHKHDAIITKEKMGRLKDSFEEDPDLVAQFDQTLAELEADLAVESQMEFSGRSLSRALSSDSDHVPVSILDLDVPVTTIDEVLEEYDSDTPTAMDDRAALPGELGNRNNNACTTAAVSPGQQPPPEAAQRQRSAERTSTSVKEEEKRTRATEVKKDPGKPTNPSTAGRWLQEEEVTQPHRAPTTSSTHGKITHNPVSRFGTKTFTVVPPKPAVVQPVAAATKASASVGAIRIDEQGNMVRAGVAHNKFGGSMEPGANEADAPLLGKAKAFWNSTEKQDGPPAPSGARGQSSKCLQQLSVKVPPLPLSPTNGKRDLSFLRPTRRTSSQYVASAISKYAPKPTPKSDGFTHIPESPSCSSSSSSGGFQKNPRSVHVRSVSPSPPPGPQRSLSQPETQTGSEEGVRQVSGAPYSAGGGVKRLDTAKNAQPASPTRPRATPSQNGVIIKHTRPVSPPQMRPQQSQKPETTVAVSAGGHGDGLPERQQVAAVFGPVKTFRAVELLAPQQQSNPHSSLMEAIQTAGGKESLRKVPARSSAVKKSSFAEEDGERWALLAAIRARSPVPRLRQPSMLPPPPPPPSPQPKPSTVHGSGANVVDPALAREVMMEAIRSGTAAEKLKKVSAPAKTVKVNGRLGTIHASSSSVPQQ
ncbi:protein cordon-bleu [Aplochiton taeniatus]